MKKLTWALGLLMIVLFTLLVWLCFFQLPSNDDFVGPYLRQKHGMAGAIKWYLSEKNGRFSTIPLFLLISASRTLLNYYGLLLLFFLFLTWFSLFGFVKILGRHLFEPGPSNTNTALIASMVLITFLCMVPELSSFIYWMATSVTYLFPFAVFLWLILAYSCLLKEGQQHKWGYTFLICLLTCFLGGSNEIMLFYACALPFLVLTVHFITGRTPPANLYPVMAFAVVLIVATLLVPGNSARAHTFELKQSLAASIALSALWTWGTLQTIFSNPFFYVSSFGILVASMYLKPAVVAFFATKRTNWLVEVAVVVGMIFCFDLVLRQIGGHVLPARATNIIVCLSMLGFWWIMLMNADRIKNLLHFFTTYHRSVTAFFIGTFLIALLGSGFFLQLGRNLVAAPIHVAVIEHRVELMAREKAAGKKTVYIPPYNETAAAIVKQQYKGKNMFILEQFPVPPSFTYFKDEPNSRSYAYFYAEFYGIDTIAGADGKFARRGLSNAEH